MSFIADHPELEIPPFPVKRWTVEEYLQFAQMGILDEDDQSELLDGWIVPKMTKNPRHDGTVDEINRLLSGVMPAGWYVRTQNVLLTTDSAPEPDVVVVKGVPRDYLDRHPTGRDVALVIEVADSSLDRDRLKAKIYARANVPACWIINLIENQIEVYADAIGAGRAANYDRAVVLRGSDLVSIQIPGHVVPDFRAEELLP